MKKDILFLLQFFYPEYISSATLPFDTASKLAEEGYSVDVLCGWPYEYIDNEKVQKKQTVNDVNIHRIKYLKLNKHNKLGRLINFFSLTVAMFFHLFSMRKYKTIVVYTNPPILPLVAAIASKLFGCKLVLVAYDVYPEIAIKTNSISKNGIITKFMNFVNRVVYSNAEAVVALSSEMKEYILQNRKISEEKVYVIPNWYKDEYKHEQKREDNSFNSVTKGRFVIGYFGNMGVAQDMEPIIDAIKYYKEDNEVCFLIAGHGLKHGTIKKIIDDEKIQNTYICGFLKEEEYLEALQISNCAIVSIEKGLTGLCAPSKTYSCMMQGLPIIAIMDESDIVKDVKNGAGYYIKDNSVEQFINLIKEIKNSPLECDEKGKISRKIYLEKYTPEICLDRYVDLFNKIFS